MLGKWRGRAENRYRGFCHQRPYVSEPGQTCVLRSVPVPGLDVPRLFGRWAEIRGWGGDGSTGPELVSASKSIPRKLTKMDSGVDAGAFKGNELLLLY